MLKKEQEEEQEESLVGGEVEHLVGVEGEIAGGGEGEIAGGGEVDRLLSQHIQRQLAPDRTDYLCLICHKSCKSRDDCANHIEVRTLQS